MTLRQARLSVKSGTKKTAVIYNSAGMLTFAYYATVHRIHALTMLLRLLTMQARSSKHTVTLM